jgi:hypothetical protein
VPHSVVGELNDAALLLQHQTEKLKNPGKLDHIDSPSVLSSFELLEAENGSSIFLRNIDNYLSVDMA